MDTRWPKQLCVNIDINRNPSYRCHQTGCCVAGGGGAPGAVQCGNSPPVIELDCCCCWAGLGTVSPRAVNKSSRSFTVPSAFFLLKVPTTTFTIKNLQQHYAKQAFKTVSRREIGTLLVQKDHNQQVVLLAKMKLREGHLTALVWCRRIWCTLCWCHWSVVSYAGPWLAISRYPSRIYNCRYLLMMVTPS